VTVLLGRCANFINAGFGPSPYDPARGRAFRPWRAGLSHIATTLRAAPFRNCRSMLGADPWCAADLSGMARRRGMKIRSG